MKITTANKIFGIGIAISAIAMLFRRVWLMELDSFEFDDAFMFIRYAENILAGYGYAWNGGEPIIYGNTSILYTYIIALNKFIFGAILPNSWILISVALFFALGFLFRLQTGLYQYVSSQWLKNRIVILIFTLPFLLFPLIFGFHISTGMETTLSLFLNTVYVFSVLQVYHKNAVSIGSVIFTVFIGWLLFLTRPDNAIVVLLFPTILFLSKKKYKPLATFLILLSLFLGVDALIKYIAFDQVLPLSFYAKKSGFTEGYTAKYFWNPVKYITQIIGYLMPYILLLFVFIRKKSAGFILAFLLPIFITFIYYFTFDQIMGFNARFYFPYIPYIIIPAILLMDMELVRLEQKDYSLWKFNAFITKTIVLIVFLIITVFSKYRFINWYESYAIKAGNEKAIPISHLENRKYNREASIKIISQLLKEFPNDFVFGATEHGFISGDNPKKKIIDFSGLQNKYIAINGYDESVLIANPPDLIWMPHQDLTVLHFEIRNGSYFKNHYDYIPDYFAFGCAIRKDSKYYDALKIKLQ